MRPQYDYSVFKEKPDINLLAEKEVSNFKCIQSVSILKVG